MLHNKPIKIGILEASPQTKAILEFFFSSSGKSVFKESSLDDASVFIMDYDYPGTKESWENLFNTTKKPGIVISIKETNLPFTYWIAKPLTTKDLFEAGKKVTELLEQGYEEPIIETIDESVIEEQSLDDVLQVATQQEKNTTIEEEELEIKEPVKQEVKAETKTIIEKTETKAELAITETDDSLESSFDFSESFEESLTEANTITEIAETKAELATTEADDALESSLDFSESFEESLAEANTITEIAETKAELAITEADDTLETSFDFSESFEESLTEANTITEIAKTKAELATTAADDALESSLDFSETLEESLHKPEIKVEKTETKKFKEVVKQEAKAELALAEAGDTLDTSFDFSDSFKGSLLETETKTEDTQVNEARDTFDHIDTFSSNSTDAKDLDIEPVLIGNNKTSTAKAELTTAISTTTAFAISPNLIKISEDLVETSETNTQPIEDTLSSIQEIGSLSEEESKKLEESEIDSLLQTLISGGKNNHLEEEKDQDIISIDNSKFDIVTPTEKEVIALKAEELKSGFLDFELDTLARNNEVKLQDDSTLAVTPEDTSKTSESELSDIGVLDLTLDSQSYEEDAIDSNEIANISLIQSNNSSSDFISSKETNEEIEGNSELDLDETLSTEQLDENIHINSSNFESEADVKTKDLSPMSAEDELQTLLDEIRKEAEGGAKKSASSMPTEKNNRQKINHIPTSAEERWIQTCGHNKEITNAKELDKIKFEPESHMLSVLLEVCEQSKQTDKILRLKFKRHIIIVDYNRDFIYYDKSIFSNEYASLCQQMVIPGVIKIHGLDKSEVRLYRKKITDNPERAHTIDSFIWTTSLLTSKGRLPKGTDINKKVGLKYWPDLTRLEKIPDAMQIAAIFYKHPGSLLEIHSWSKIDQRYIFAFYNASLSLDLIEFDGKKMRSSSQDLKNSSKKTKNRGFFSRLLKRIKS